MEKEVTAPPQVLEQLVAEYIRAGQEGYGDRPSLAEKEIALAVGSSSFEKQVSNN